MRGNARVGQSLLSTDHPDDDVRHAVLRLVTWVDGKGGKARVSSKGRDPAGSGALCKGALRLGLCPNSGHTHSF